MPIALIGSIVVAVTAFFFGYLLFRGMVYEWHRRDGDAGAAS